MTKHSEDPQLITQAQGLLQRVNSEGDPALLARLADADATANVKTYPGDVDALLIQVEADWRAWLLTHDRAWLGLALQRAAAPNFPVAHLPTNWGNEFVNVASSTSTAQGYTAADVANAERFIARLKAVDPIRVIVTVNAVPHDVYLTTLAPADEYFGPLGMSILGIENRLKHINFMLDYNYGNAESDEGTHVAESIDDMQKVYPRDRDLPMLLYWSYTTLERMTDEQSRQSARAIRSDSHGRIPRQPPSSQASRYVSASRTWIRYSPTACSLRLRSCSITSSRSGRWGWRRSLPRTRGRRRAIATRRRRGSRVSGRRSFAINFATGVVTGIPMEFQFGTNWAAFSRRSGSVVGQPLAMEGMFAFFLESIFLGVLLYRRASCTALFTAWSAVLRLARLVALRLLHRRHRCVDAASGRLRSRSRRHASDSRASAAVLSSPFAWWQFAHVLDGALLAGGFIVAGIGAYYLLVAPRRSDRAAFRAGRRRSSRLIFSLLGDLSDRRPQRRRRHGLSAGQARRDGRALRDRRTVRRSRSSACPTSKHQQSDRSDLRSRVS